MREATVGHDLPMLSVRVADLTFELLCQGRRTHIVTLARSHRRPGRYINQEWPDYPTNSSFDVMSRGSMPFGMDFQLMDTIRA